MEDQDLYQEYTTENPIVNNEELTQRADPLSLDLKDDYLVETIDNRIDDSRRFFKKNYNLYERRKKLEEFVFGRQIDQKEKELKSYESRYLDNAIYEIEASLKPLAMSRLPDMIVTPGQDTKESKKVAEDVSKIIDSDLKKRENRIALGIAFKHLPVYFTGIIKAIWNVEKDDYEFRVIHPDLIDVDATCTSNNADDMSFIAEIINTTPQECFMRFPNAKEELKEELRKDGILPPEGEPKNKDLLSDIKIREVWFTDYKKRNDKWERIEGVVWKYKNCILHKMKNPNFDYEGEEKYFTYEDINNLNSKTEVGVEDMQAMMLGLEIPDNISKETIYRNYFKMPRKPYFFLGYDQWRKMPYDETSRIEQNYRNQENLDRRGKRIVEKMEGRIKHIWSKDSGLKKTDIEKMDLDNPRQDVLVEGQVNQVHAEVRPEQVSAQEFRDLDQTRQRMYAVAGANAIRGELQTDVATSNQIAREADFTRADDLVEDTINAASEWMADWSMQFIKLRYTDDHFRKLFGQSGQITFYKINQDMIEDGMEVTIKSSGTDKLKAQKQAMEMAGMQLVDPLTFYEDLGLSNPVGRVEKLILFQTNPAMYMARYVQGLENTTAMANQLVAPAVPQQAGQPPTSTPQNPSMGNTSAIPTEPQESAPQGSPRGLV
jgi:hypothetical protein